MGGEWYPLYRFETTPRDLKEFQPMCDQHQSNTKEILGSTPLVIMRKSEDMTYMIIGRRFTTIKFLEETDVRENLEEVSDDKMDEILRNVFDIKLKEPLKFSEIALKKELDETDSKGKKEMGLVALRTKLQEEKLKL